MAGRPNPKRAKTHRNYTVAEAAALFGVHRNTVKNWIKAGLQIVDTERSRLILGDELRQFLERKVAKLKRRCPPGHLYCFKCREPREPQIGSAVVLRQSAQTGNLRALCACCGTRMFRQIRLERLSAAGFGGAPVTPEETHLADSPNPSLICH